MQDRYRGKRWRGREGGSERGREGEWGEREGKGEREMKRGKVGCRKGERGREG